MLTELRLNNLAIIKNLDVEFGSGLIAMTGETGAGKSIILDGISLLIGERSHIDMIRHNEDSFFVEGVFSVTENQKIRLRELDFEIGLDENELIISRTYDRNSKSKITVNGVRVTVAKLKELMTNIIDLVGQHEHQYLLDKSYHLSILDKYLDRESQELLKNISSTVSNIRKSKEKIFKLKEEKEKIEERRDIYEYQVNEIDGLELKVGEDTELENEYKILFNAGKIDEKLQDSKARINDGEFAVSSSLSKIRKNIEQLIGISENYNEIFDKIENVIYEIDEISYTIDNYIDEINLDEHRLTEVVARIDEINKLKLKYGSTIEEILEYREDIMQKLSMIATENGEISKLEKYCEEETKKYFELAEILSNKRKEIAKNLEKTIEGQFLSLNMKSAQFKVNFDKNDEVSSKGIDDVEFMMITNVGDDFKPLVKIASGGEISRIMLALKSVFSEVDNISVLIFDEIDTGISGETVKCVAEKLRELSEKVQVICVTHSSQIAGLAHEQFFIKKEVENGRTETKVYKLNYEERVREIARIISGDNITEASLEHAKEIIL